MTIFQNYELNVKMIAILYLFNPKIVIKKSSEFSLNNKLLEIDKIMFFVLSIFVKYHCNIQPFEIL